MFDTIAAISSGYINQPISLIRVSGPEAFDIVKKIFSGKEGLDKTITYGYVKDGNESVDEVLVSWFEGPNTFTGENIVEINAHGGLVNSQRILELLLTNGARMAENGEFSRRAFLNGKLDLVKAEAIHDLIFAKTQDQAKLSVKKFDGTTSKLIKDLLDKLMNTIATIETNIDYPEYDDVEQLTNENILPKLNEVKNRLIEIKESSKMSRYIFEGINVAIVGKPNVGKSSLLNVLLNEDKAIVTDIPGTTRDIVEGSIQIGQVLFNFKDTAGIHESSNKVESIGIEKSLSEIDKSDVVIHLINIEEDHLDENKEIENLSKDKIYIPVYTKKDIKKIPDGKIAISAKNKDVKDLIVSLHEHFKDINLNNELLINNTRQLSLIDKSINNINSSIKGIENGLEPDEVILDIRSAWKDLGNIIGESSDEKLLDTMFKNFCLGK